MDVQASTRKGLHKALSLFMALVLAVGLAPTVPLAYADGTKLLALRGF